MRKLLAVAFMVLAVPAYAQVGMEIYKPATPAQILPYTNASTAITAAIFHRVVRLMCTTSCYILFQNPTSPVAVTTVTGMLLPANVPEYFITSSSNKVYVISDLGNGKLHVQEMSK